MYWGATWNLLNSYFFTKSIPNKKINSLLRIGVGMAILAFPDNDIKEAGGNWYGIDDDEDLDSLNSIDDEELQEHPHRLHSWQGRRIQDTAREV